MGFDEKDNKLSVLEDATLIQIHNTYIIAPASSGFLMIHQQLAHERILYEKYQRASMQAHATQKSLFPVVLELSASDSVLLEEIIPDLALIGYELESFGPNSFVIQGIPADVDSGNEKMPLNYYLNNSSILAIT